MSALIVAYFFVFGENKPPLEESKFIDSGAQLNKAQEIKDASSENSNTETVQGRSLNLPSCNTISPFSSGQVLCNHESDSKFKEPNTEWGVRTLNGVTYVFGEGNPINVALTIDNLRTLIKHCMNVNPRSDEYKEYYPYPCNEEDGYVTPKVERYLKLVLEDENWAFLIEKCKDNLKADYINGYIGSPYIENISYEKITQDDYLDINNFLFIDVNGRKRLDVARVYGVRDFLTYHTKDYYSFYSKTKPFFRNGLDCVDRYASSILFNLDQTLTANSELLDGARLQNERIEGDRELRQKETSGEM